MPEPSWIALFQTLLEWIKAPWKMFAIIFLICISALFAPNSWLQAIHMAAWVQKYWALLVFFGSFSGLFLAITGIEERVKPIGERRRRKRETDEKYSKLEATLKSLRADEVGILTRFNASSSTQDFHQTDGVIRNLAFKGVVHLVNDTGYFMSFSLTDDAIAFLTDRGFQTISEAISVLKR